MKKISPYIYLFFILLISCEEVVDVNLNTTAPKLVIDASINWYKGTVGNQQEINLSLTAPFFQENIPPATGAIVQIANGNSIYIFTEDGTTGSYKNNTFVPILNETYQLTIQYNNETYTATETLQPVVAIDYVEQNNTGGFSGEDIELKAYYTDPINEENYYFFEFLSNATIAPTLEVYDDEFTNGNQIFGYYSHENLEANQEVTIRNYGISEQFYNFMFILLQQNTQGGGPFETQPATVRGNCINQTNQDNYPLGYFRLSEVDEVIYTTQ